MEHDYEIDKWSPLYVPRVLPAMWWPMEGRLGWYESHHGLRVCSSTAREKDGRVWLHVSVSRRDRVPSYDDLVRVKELFVGKERKAIQVFAPASEHVNVAENCLHLWCCIDGDGLPDFRKDGEI